MAEANYEPINGNMIQTLNYLQSQFTPINGSWEQALYASIFGEIENPTNGSWLYTLVYDFYNNNNGTYDGFEIINGNLWQTLCYIVGYDYNYFFDNYGIDEQLPLNGSWLNTYMQGLILDNGGEIPIPIIGEVLEYDYNPFIDNPGDGGLSFESPINVTGTGSGLLVTVSKSSPTFLSIKLLSGGEAYNVGDIVRIPAGTISGVIVDIDITIIEVRV